MYATVEDLRAEGVTEAQAADERLDALIDEASRIIDRATGWFFEPRELAYALDGRGTPSLEPPAPPIRIERLAVDGAVWPIDPDALIVVGAPVRPDFDAPRLTLRGRRFPRGRGNVEATGLWGYIEDDGTDTGRTPREIRRVCMLIVLRLLPPLADTSAAEDARNRWRVIEERTRDQSYRLGAVEAGPFTGDPEIDRVLLRFRRPPGMGAA